VIGQQPGVQHSRQELDTERKNCPTEKICCDHRFAWFGTSGLKNNVRKYTARTKVQTYKVLLELMRENVQDEAFCYDQQIEWLKKID
jgi:hypothetical protein